MPAPVLACWVSQGIYIGRMELYNFVAASSYGEIEADNDGAVFPHADAADLGWRSTFREQLQLLLPPLTLPRVSVWSAKVDKERRIDRTSFSTEFSSNPHGGFCDSRCPLQKADFPLLPYDQHL